MQNVVGDTAQQVESHSARQEAAQLATVELTDRWRAEVPTSQADADRLNLEYSQKCSVLGIIYGDIDLVPKPAPGNYLAGTGWNPVPGDVPSCNLV